MNNEQLPTHVPVRTEQVALFRSARSLQVPRRRIARHVSALATFACLGLPAIAACGGDAAASDDAGSTFCAQLDNSAGLAETLGDPTSDPGDVAAAFDRLTQLAPNEIRSDVSVVADAIVTLAESPTDDPEVLSDALDVVLSPEVTSATERIGAYAVETCGMTPSAWEG